MRSLLLLVVMIAPVRAQEKAGEPVLVPQVGHEVKAAAFSPDGKLIATAGGDNRVKLWTRDGKLLRTIDTVSKPESVAFAPDGGSLLVGGGGGRAERVDLFGKNLRRFELGDDLRWRYEAGIHGVAFSPDGKLLAAAVGSFGEDEGEAVIWNADGAEVARLRGHKGGVFAVAFAPDGKSVVTGGRDKTARRWGLDGKELVRYSGFSGHGGPVRSVAFSPDGAKVLTAGADGAAILWSAEGRKLQAFKGHKAPLSGAAFSPDGRQVATACAYDSDYSKGEDRRLRLFDLDGRAAGEVDTEEYRNIAPVFSPDGKAVLLGRVLWNLKDGTFQRAAASGFGTASAKVTALVFMPDSRHLVSASDRITYWGFDKAKPVELGYEVASFLAVSGDGKTVAAAIYEGVQLFSLAGPRPEKRALIKQEGVYRLFVSPDGKRIAGVTRDWKSREKAFDQRTLVIWGPDGKVEKTVVLEPYVDSRKMTAAWEVYAVEFPGSGHGFRLHAGVYRGVPAVFDDGGRPLQVKPLPEPQDAAVLSPDGKLRAVGGDDGVVTFLDNRYNPVVRVFLRYSDRFIFAPDGRFDMDAERFKSSVSFRLGGTNDALDLDQLYDRFYAPNLLESALFSRPPEMKETLGELMRLSPAPSVALKAEEGAGGKNKQARVTVTACDKGGGVASILLYHNGALVGSPDARGFKPVGSCPSTTLSVNLLPGKNSFRGEAKSAKGMGAASEPLEIVYTPESVAKPNQIIVAVAINEYRNPNFKLKYAVPDARAMADKFVEKGRKLFEKTLRFEAFDQAANRAGVADAFARAAAAAREEDMAIIFLAGHGVAQERRYYFMTQENPMNSETAIALGIPQEELTAWISNIKARKKLVIIDTCQAGGDWLVAVRGADEQAALGILARSAGVFVIAASLGSQDALESSKTGHGLLTTSLLEGLDGKAGGPSLSANDLVGYAEKRVTSLALEMYGREQFPYPYRRGQDFPLH